MNVNPEEERLRELGAHIAEQHAPHIEALQEGLLERFVEDAAIPPRSESRRVSLIAAAACAAAMLILVGAWMVIESRSPSSPSPSGHPITMISGQWHRAEHQSETLHFEDGSRLIAAPHTRFQTTKLRPEWTTITLEQGSLEVLVEHHSRTQWTFQAGPYTVEVTGTRFQLGWSPAEQSFELSMTEGSVILHGPDNLRRTLTRGDSVQLSNKPAEVAPPALPAEEADMLSSETPLEELEPAPELEAREHARFRRDRRVRRRSWQELARDGSYEQALSEANRVGFDKLCKELPAETLYELADMARFAGARAPSKRAYESIRARFPRHELSSRAAFDLGVLSQGRASIDWFEAYLRERPGGPLAREALGRLLELQVQARDRSRIEQTAREYLTRYPRGPYAKLARAQLKE